MIIDIIIYLFDNLHWAILSPFSQKKTYIWYLLICQQRRVWPTLGFEPRLPNSHPILVTTIPPTHQNEVFFHYHTFLPRYESRIDTTNWTDCEPRIRMGVHTMPLEYKQATKEREASIIMYFLNQILVFWTKSKMKTLDPKNLWV